MKAIRKAMVVLPLSAILALPILLGQVGGPIEVVIGKGATAKSQLEIAYGLQFSEKNHEGAIAAYRDLLNRFPESEEAAEAQFRIANIYELISKHLT